MSRFQRVSIFFIIQVGLQKLEFAETQVAIMSEELKDLQPQLIQTSKETEDLMGVIQRDTEEVEKVKNVVEEDEEVANRAAAESQSIKVSQRYRPLLQLPPPPRTPSYRRIRFLLRRMWYLC